MINKLIFIYLLFPYLIYCQSTPNVPEVIDFDKIRLKINNDTRKEIQNEVDALHANDKFFKILIDRVNIYFPIIEEVLKEENIPEDFKFLALQESALISDAVSASNAVGFW